MKQLFFLFTAFSVCIVINAQTKKPVAPPTPDVNAMLKMTPAELEAYKKKMIQQSSQYAADYADANGLAINKATIPGLELKPPVKDIKKLSLIPVQPPTRTELVNGIQQSMQQLQKGMPVPQIEQITTTVSMQPVAVVHQKAVMEFYTHDQRTGLMMMMQLASKSPDSLLYLNNLGAMYNVTGVMHKAIPLLRYCLEKNPGSAMVLGNIGQSYLALGDMLTAASYFRQCLEVDSLHLESNHSMGMIHYFKKEYDKAMFYFERELSVAVRRSTLAMAYKMGKKFNLRALAKRRNSRNGVAEKDFLEEITLGKFRLPDFPQSVEQLLQMKSEIDAMAASFQAEYLFWMNNSNQISLSYSKPKGDQFPGLYADLVNAMLEELHEEFTPEYLMNISDADHEAIKEIITRRGTQLNKMVCPEAPAGSSIETQEAYAIKCCEEQMRPIADALLGELGDRIQPLYRVGVLRWKAYINQLVAIVQLEPSDGNRQMVYNAVAGYFNYLSTGLFYYSSEIKNFLTHCKGNYNASAIDSLIESNRLWNVNCASWMNMEVSIASVTLKADCNKFAIEGGSAMMGGFEHEFKSHKSTFLLGPGLKGDIGGVINGELKTQFFLTFDDHLQFADFGVKRTAEVGISGTPIPLGVDVKVGGNLAGVEISDKIGIMSGYSSEIEWKGLAAWYMDWLKQ